MYLHTETIKITSSLFYTTYLMTFSSDVFVDKLNDNTFIPEYQLERIGGKYNSLFITQYAVDTEQGLIYFASASVGLTFKIQYYTNGEINPFNMSSNLNQIITRLMLWSSKRICDGLYINEYDEDASYLKRLEGGSVIYNNNIYAVKKTILNFNELSPPRLLNLYRGYYFFINNYILSTYLNTRTQTISNIGILTSSGIYETVGQAKLDVLDRYATLYSDPPLEIAYLYQSIGNDNMRTFIIHYIKESRVI